jgi:hypothetical protein
MNKLKEKKKRAAVMAAVTTYIKSQEEAMMMAGSGPVLEKEVRTTPLPPPSLWGVSGRQDMMNFRNMMQMKAFHGVKFR